MAANSPIDVSTAPTLGLAWATDIYGAALDSPVVAYDPLLHQTLAYVGNENGDVEAVNLTTGALVWGTWLGAPIRTTPVVSNGSVYVGTFTSPAIYRLNASTGAVVCSVPAPMPVEGTPTLATPPGGVPTLYVGSNDNAFANGPLLAMNASTCWMEWEFTKFLKAAGAWDPVSYADLSGVGKIFFGTADPDSAVYALNARTGAQIWRFQSYDPTPGQYDVGAGVTLAPHGVPGLAGGTGFVPSKYGTMYALNLSTGAQVWNASFQKQPPQGDTGRSTAALAGDDLVFGDSTGLMDLNASTGRRIWSYNDSYRAEAISCPAIMGAPGAQVVAVGDVAGNLDVVSLSTGSPLYVHATGGYVTASPAVDEGNLLIASSNGFLEDFVPGGGNDVVLPTTSISTPAAGASLPNPNGALILHGNASSPVGVAAVIVAVQSGNAAGPWWDASTSSWVPGPDSAGATLATPGATSSAWTFSLPVPSAGGTYSAYAYAVSIDGSSDLKGAVVQFSVVASVLGPHLRASPSDLVPGSDVTLTGGGFLAGERIVLTMGSSTLGSATASSTGSLRATKVKVPSNTPFGPSSVTATGSTSGKAASATVRIGNNWDEVGGNVAQENFESNDPTLMNHVYLGANDWMVLAWHFYAGSPIAGAPAVVGGVAYVAAEGGEVFALDDQNGGLLWTWTAPAGTNLSSSPAVDPTADEVFVVSNQGELFALSGSTGALQWSTALGGPSSAPIFWQGVLYVSVTKLLGGLLLAVDEATGARVWSLSTIPPSLTPPALDTSQGLMVVATSGGPVLLVNASSGAILKSTWLWGPFSSAPCIAKGAVYLTTPGGVVYALNERTLAPLWSFSAGARILASPSFVTEGTVRGQPELVVGTSSGTLDVLNITTGKPFFLMSYGSPIVGVTALKGILVVSTAGGVAHASRAYTNLAVWSYTTQAGLSSAPAIVDGAFYLGALDGNLYVFTDYGQPPD
jgi:eukaryotic-like serine/threonine-protein kinase